MTENSATSSSFDPHAAPGWYPVDAVSQRYWDGYEWTNQTAPLSTAQQFSAQATESNRVYALVMHLGGIFFTILVPLIMWLVKTDDPFISHHGRQAVNLHLTFYIMMAISFPLIFVVVGIGLALLAVTLFFVFGVLAGIKASQGEYYRIPVAFQLL